MYRPFSVYKIQGFAKQGQLLKKLGSSYGNFIVIHIQHFGTLHLTLNMCLQNQVTQAESTRPS